MKFGETDQSAFCAVRVLLRNEFLAVVVPIRRLERIILVPHGEESWR